MEVLSSTNKLNFHNGTSNSPIVTEAHSATLTNKTIDGDDNTVQDLGLGSLKTVLADAGKILQRDGSGAVVSGAVIPVGGDVVTTTGTQARCTRTNASITANAWI